MRIKLSLLLSFCLLVLLAFKSGHSLSKSEMVGQYGSCNTDQVSDYCIDLQKDGSFILVNFKNNQNNPVLGKWYLDGDKIMLTGYPEVNKIPNTWKIDEEGKCIKARQQFQFVRLCSAQKCTE